MTMTKVIKLENPLMRNQLKARRKSRKSISSIKPNRLKRKTKNLYNPISSKKLMGTKNLELCAIFEVDGNKISAKELYNLKRIQSRGIALFENPEIFKNWLYDISNVSGKTPMESIKTGDYDAVIGDITRIEHGVY